MAGLCLVGKRDYFFDPRFAILDDLEMTCEGFLANGFSNTQHFTLY